MDTGRVRRKPGLLVVVHPGSACGSADFNLGRRTAATARSRLVEGINRWTGGVLVVDGALSHELPRWPILESALDDALTRARSAGLSHGRMFACAMETPRWEDEVVRAMDGLSFPKDGEVAVTGAWHSGDGSGCVDSTALHLASSGWRRTAVAAHALQDGPPGE